MRVLARSKGDWMLMTKTDELFTRPRRRFMIIYGANILCDKRHRVGIEKLTEAL